MQTRSKTIASKVSSNAADSTLFCTPEPRRKLKTPERPSNPAALQLEEFSKDDDWDNIRNSTFGEDGDESNEQKYQYARITPMNLNRELFEPSFRYPRPNGNAPKYDVNIDFDESSSAWRSNKLLVGEGHFVYKCDSCERRRVKGSDFCGIHRRSNKK